MRCDWLWIGLFFRIREIEVEVLLCGFLLKTNSSVLLHGVARVATPRCRQLTDCELRSFFCHSTRFFCSVRNRSEQELTIVLIWKHSAAPSFLCIAASLHQIVTIPYKTMDQITEKLAPLRKKLDKYPQLQELEVSHCLYDSFDWGEKNLRNDQPSYMLEWS